nr:DEAD/DEAH box helicase family protein [Tessaracoccus sp. MC1865]
MLISKSNWDPDPGLVQEIEDHYQRALGAYSKNPNLISEHANQEESVRVGGYANRTLLELVQNGADAMAGISGEEHGRVEILLDEEDSAVYVANSGRPFSSSGLRSLFHAHLSAKRGDEIGRFGLGFKSVLAVSEAPQVFSRSVSFQFNAERARADLTKLPGGAARFPILRTPTLLDSWEEFQEDPVLEELSRWATTIVKLPAARNLSRLRDEVEDFHSEFLLFVRAVREIRLRVIGDDRFTTSHSSRETGPGRLRIERPSGEGEDWLVAEQMHRPSHEAKKEVGEAVSRDEVKVTVAVPLGTRAQAVGKFWSYFPLADQTTASGLFNAPWSVNDDRTNLLVNSYNEEILQTVSEMFVELVPNVRTADDPALHLRYLPARGREIRSWGDQKLSTLIPAMAATSCFIPDAKGVLRKPGELRPLDFLSELDISERTHEAWCMSPHTGDDVPHPRCYGDRQRLTRLRTLCAVQQNSDLFEEETRDWKRALEQLPKRGGRSWLREWADGPDLVSAADALRVAAPQKACEEAVKARVIPTTAGLKSLDDHAGVYMRRVEDVEVEDAVFVLEAFLEEEGIERLLRENRFQDLSPSTLLRARLMNLSRDPQEEELLQIWDNVLDLPLETAKRVFRECPGAAIKVPTRDGGWDWPQRVIDLERPLAGEFESVQLDPRRCVRPLAHSLGVISGAVKDFQLEDEPLEAEYQQWVLDSINACLGPGERPIERLSLFPTTEVSSGPASVLLILLRSHASSEERVKWTERLLAWGDEPWDGEDEAGVNHRVPSPVAWAVEVAGLLNTIRGPLHPSMVVSPTLTRYHAFLPLLKAPSVVAEALGLPRELDCVAPEILARALNEDEYPGAVTDELLLEFVLAAAPVAYPNTAPARILARVGGRVESREPSLVYLAHDDEQQDFLRSRQKPYLRVAEDDVDQVVESLRCMRFEDSFSFSVEWAGEQRSDQVLDAFPGLREPWWAQALTHASVTRAAEIEKLVTTEDGVVSETLDWHLEGLNLIVASGASDKQVLDWISDAFALGLNHADILSIMQAGVNAQLEAMRAEAAAAQTDAQRLEAYFGDDTLKDQLPQGLWVGLESQGLVNRRTSVADLFLTVYGTDSVKNLKDQFMDLGFGDVPESWAGSPAAVQWLRRMGFGPEYAGTRRIRQDAEFIVPGAVTLPPLHDFQSEISAQMNRVLTERDAKTSRHLKAMLELPTGAGKTRVATETVLRAFISGDLQGTVLWIAQSQELCEQAVQTWSTVWRGLGDERPLTVGRLWESNDVSRPETEFSVVVATDAKLDVVLGRAEYEWLSKPAAVIVDEAHRSGDSTLYTRIFQWLGIDGRSWDRPLVGLSATPFKGQSGQGTANLATRYGSHRLTAFTEGQHQYDELVKRGVLARVRHEVLPGVKVDLDPKERADAAKSRRFSAVVMDRVGRDQERMRILADHVLSQDPEWPILVFTPSVLSAQVLAATLRYRGATADSVSGQTGRYQRQEAIKKFKNGETQILANCDLLIQGFDAPGVKALYIARPTISPNAYIQMAGRGLRGPRNGGKEECLIVDLADNFGDLNDFLGYREYEEYWGHRRW